LTLIAFFLCKSFRYGILFFIYKTVQNRGSGSFGVTFSSEAPGPLKKRT
jgi:hypothetical protein